MVNIDTVINVEFGLNGIIGRSIVHGLLVVLMVVVYRTRVASERYSDGTADRARWLQRWWFLGLLSIVASGGSLLGGWTRCTIAQQDEQHEQHEQHELVQPLGEGESASTDVSFLLHPAATWLHITITLTLTLAALAFALTHSRFLSSLAFLENGPRLLRTARIIEIFVPKHSEQGRERARRQERDKEEEERARMHARERERRGTAAEPFTTFPGDGESAPLLGGGVGDEDKRGRPPRQSVGRQFLGLFYSSEQEKGRREVEREAALVGKAVEEDEEGSPVRATLTLLAIALLSGFVTGATFLRISGAPLLTLSLCAHGGWRPTTATVLSAAISLAPRAVALATPLALLLQPPFSPPLAPSFGAGVQSLVHSTPFVVESVAAALAAIATLAVVVRRTPRIVSDVTASNAPSLSRSLTFDANWSLVQATVIVVVGLVYAFY